MPTTLDVAAGQTFGRLTVVSRAPNKTYRRQFNCRCECGTEKEVDGPSLVSGAVLSCGCLRRERSQASGLAGTRHGEARPGKQSPTYRSWMSMRTRTKHKTNKCYEHIEVVPEWHSFERFKADMGERPDGTTLDRIDGTKGYGPGNCRWATDVEQARNKRTNVYLTAYGQTKLLVEWAEGLGVSAAVVRQRLRAGWSVEEAVSVFLNARPGGRRKRS